MPKPDQGLIPLEVIEGKILVLRGRRVMLDRDLAELYGVETRVLNQAVNRNSDRFPDDFMFRLTFQEGKAVLPSRSQFVTLKRGQNIKYQPHVFTEHGAVMLANVLRSPVAATAGAAGEAPHRIRWSGEEDAGEAQAGCRPRRRAHFRRSETLAPKSQTDAPRENAAMGRHIT